MLVIEKFKVDELKRELVYKFLKNDVEKYIFGRNKNAERLAKDINISGYIDDFTDKRNWNNKPIYKSNQIQNKNSIVVSSSLAIYPNSAINSLQKIKFQNIISILDIAIYDNFEIIFMSDAKKDLELNFSNYEKIYNYIKETESQNIFRNILNFRKNFDLEYMKSYKVDSKGQYFEEFLDLKDGEVFIDAGGFDGQTSIEFIKHCPNYKSIYIFEPDIINLEMAKKNLVKHKNVNFISKGLSNHKDTLKFDMGSGSASKISEIGAITIEVDTLDNLVKEKITFIKMDIEGAEGLAIEGMKNHILNDYPKMAISVYHKVDDFWKIPQQIFNIRNDYDIYMRHYTEGTDETVMFFIPKRII